MQLKFDGNGFSKSVKTKRLIEQDVDMRTLAKELGISISTISRVENGKTPDLLTYARLCKWIDVPLTKFIKKAK